MQGRFYKKVNTSRNQLKIKKALEEYGHKDVEVWWEPVRSGCEMCGPEGGFFFSSDLDTLEPLGYSMDDALESLTGYDYRNYLN